MILLMLLEANTIKAWKIVYARATIVLWFIPLAAECTLALPSPQDTPEEILRTEIITDARSPLDGKPLTAAEYVQLQSQLQNREIIPPLDPKVKEAVVLLRLRQLLRKILPFLPI